MSLVIYLTASSTYRADRFFVIIGEECFVVIGEECFFVIGDIKGCFLGVGHTGGLLVVIDGCCLGVYLGGDFCVVF